MNYLYAKIFRAIRKRPRTLAKIGKMCGYKKFEDFYDDNYYHGLFDSEFWDSVVFGKTEKEFGKTRIESITPRAKSLLEERHRQTRRFWIPIVISIAAFIISVIALVGQILTWQAQALQL
jgi:hypothetical protein